MRTNIKVTDMTLPAESAEYLRRRLDSIEKFIFAEPDAVLIDVEVGRTTEHHRSGFVFRAELNVHIEGKHFRSVSEQEDLHAAIDDAKDQLVNELARHKGKRIALARRGAAVVKAMVKGLWRK